MRESSMSFHSFHHMEVNENKSSKELKWKNLGHKILHIQMNYIYFQVARELREQKT